MDLIDVPLTREQFACFDAEIVEQLCEATQSDLQRWSGRLLAAWQAGDQDEVGRAHHALKGVCGIYGADALMALAAEPLITADAAQRLNHCLEGTILAIQAIAAARSTDQ